MPQMMPMNWLFLFIFMFISLFTLYPMIYFFFKSNINLKSFKKLNQNNMKLLW